MINFLMKMLSYIKPVDEKKVVVAGDLDLPITRSGRKPGILPGNDCVRFRTIDGAEFDFVGYSVRVSRKTGNTIMMYDFYHPETGTEFSLTEKVAKLILCKTTAVLEEAEVD